MEVAAIKAFGEALAIGLLIGSERYRDREEGEQRSAGMRTFAIIALLGAVCSLPEGSGFALLTFGGLVLFLALGYAREVTQSYGLTTEMAALLTFWLGYLVKDFETLSVGTGIVVAIILASKKALHGFVREQVSENEFFDTLKFLAVVFVVYPMLPDRYVGPLEFFNPAKLWILIILISSIGYAGYVLIRVLGERKGLAVSAFFGGIVSTAAVTLSLAQRSRELPTLSRLCGVTGVMANAVQFPRLVLLVWLIAPNLALYLLLPMAAMSLIGFFGAWLAFVSGREDRKDQPIRPVLRNPYSLVPVLKFGLFFLGIFFVTRVANLWFGEQGILVASALAGLGSVSAIALSVADMVGNEGTSIQVAGNAVFLALFSNALLKWVLACINGTRQLASWLGLGFLIMLGTGFVVMIVESNY